MDLSGLSHSLHNGGGGVEIVLVDCFPDLHKLIHSFFNSSMYSEVMNNTSSNMILLKCQEPLEIPMGITSYLPYVASSVTLHTT